MSQSQSDVLAHFIAMTGLDEVPARAMLDACGWSLEQAVAVFISDLPSGGATGSGKREAAKRGGRGALHAV